MNVSLLATPSRFQVLIFAIWGSPADISRGTTPAHILARCFQLGSNCGSVRLTAIPPPLLPWQTPSPRRASALSKSGSMLEGIGVPTDFLSLKSWVGVPVGSSDLEPGSRKT